MNIIMRATLHDHVPNTYYGQWPGEKLLFAGLESPAIAHNELAASARFMALTFRSGISQQIARHRVGNLCLDHKEKSVRLAKWRASSGEAAHRFHLKHSTPTVMPSSAE